MNKIINAAFVAAVISFGACSGSQDSEEVDTDISTDHVEKLTTIEFSELAFDFGTITEGEKVEHTFVFKNTGSEDLVIVSAKGSCGCTVPKWPKEPIRPGATGEIQVVFSSEGKSGKQHKNVSVVANTEPATTVIAITGEIIAPDPKTEPAKTNSEG